MLKHEDFLKQFPIILHTNRDAESPTLVEYIEKIAPVKSLLDIGADYSWHTYAPLIRPFIEEYHAIDVLDDPKTAEIVDTYTVGNANNEIFSPPISEVVISVSVFEHCGLSTYKGDHKEERFKLFKKCLALASKYVWVSFDVGQEWIDPDQYSPITEPELDKWEKHLKTTYPTAKLNQYFFYNQGAQAGHPWYKHTKRDVALKIPYIEYIGNQSICVMEIEK